MFVEILRKIISGEYCAKMLGVYLLTKQDIKDALKEALASGVEIIVEDGNGSILGYLFLDQDRKKIGFIPYTHHTLKS